MFPCFPLPQREDCNFIYLWKKWLSRFTFFWWIGSYLKLIWKVRRERMCRESTTRLAVWSNWKNIELSVVGPSGCNNHITRRNWIRACLIPWICKGRKTVFGNEASILSLATSHIASLLSLWPGHLTTTTVCLYAMYVCLQRAASSSAFFLLWNWWMPLNLNSAHFGWVVCLKWLLGMIAFATYCYISHLWGSNAITDWTVQRSSSKGSAMLLSDQLCFKIKGI